MRSMTLARKVLIVMLAVVLLAVIAYFDIPTYFDDTQLSVYYHKRANCEHIKETEHVSRHSLVRARMIEGLTKCPYCD